MMDSGGLLNEELEQLPPGFRFHPTDEELITYYLTHKISEVTFGARAIAEVDLTKCEPWDLPEKAKMGEKEWYFFSLRDRKYPTGVRTNRATMAGYWKTTGKDKEIFSSSSSSSNTTRSELVGLKKTLVFYRGRAPRGEKTNWIMHEYRLCAKYAAFVMTKKDEWVVCRVFMKSSSGAGRKNIPSNQQPRASSNAYQIELGQYHPTMPSSIDKDSNFHYAGAARSYPYANAADIMDLTRLAKGSYGPSSSLIQRSQLGFQGGGFSSALAAGLNLNLGAASTVSVPSLPQIRATLADQPLLSSSGMANDTVIGAMDGGLINQSFMDQFEGYWPSY